jgi:N-acetylmuramoyl-L-alanine amidase
MKNRMLAARPLAAALLLSLCVLVPATVASGEIFLVELDDGRTDHVEVTTVEGARYFRLADIARAVGASRHWNPRTSKMSLAVGIHQLSMSSDNPFVALDGEAINVQRDVRFVDGEFWVPARFVTYALGLAVNSDITLDEPRSSITVEKLGAEVLSVMLEERPGSTAAVISMNDRAQFAVRSRERGRIDFFLPGAVLRDSLDVLEGVGLISSLVLEQSDAGINAVIRTAPSATAYDAQMNTDPPGLEVVVVAEREQSIPSPLLKGTKNLLADTPFSAVDDGIETVMIDPGHGGSDTGNPGRLGEAEKDVALEIAEDVARFLRREGLYVFMTRSSDSQVSIKRRAEIANLSGADIFVSIHCGAWHSGGATGFRISYYEPTRQDTDDKNSAGGRGLRRGTRSVRRSDAGDLLWGRPQEELQDESRTLARAVRGHMARELPNYDRGVGGADLSVLEGCAMPAILVEPGFLTNASDAELLGGAQFRESVARAISLGVVEFVELSRRRGR